MSTISGKIAYTTSHYATARGVWIVATRNRRNAVIGAQEREQNAGASGYVDENTEAEFLSPAECRAIVQSPLSDFAYWTRGPCSVTRRRALLKFCPCHDELRLVFIHVRSSGPTQITKGFW